MLLVNTKITQKSALETFYHLMHNNFKSMHISKTQLTKYFIEIFIYIIFVF